MQVRRTLLPVSNSTFIETTGSASGEEVMPWFTFGWYQFLFEKPFSFEKLVCRIKGHPNGIVFFNVNGLEPDDRCIDCGDHI